MERLLTIGEELASDSELQNLVKRHEFEIVTATSAEEGLCLFRAQQPSAVIVEHDLGQDDGVEVLKELCQEDPNCAVILVTSMGATDAAIDVLRAGALDYLRRPLKLDEMSLALGRARDRRKDRQTLVAPVILILEDHEPTRRRLVRVLEREGYRVDAAGDGEQGMRLFQERRYDLILADVRMPGKDGLTVLAETKGQGADVEVIVVTGHGDEDIVVSALRQGAINFLRKPLDIDQMLLAIEKALLFQTTRRSLAYRNREMELMQELVLRLTQKLELVVEAPGSLAPRTLGFVTDILDALPVGILVLNGSREVVFKNNAVAGKVNGQKAEFGVEWLRALGLKDTQPDELAEVLERLASARPGVVERLPSAGTSLSVMTPVKVVKAGTAERFLVMVVRDDSIINT